MFHGTTKQFGRMLSLCRRPGDDTLVVGNGAMGPAVAALRAIGLTEEDVTVIEDADLGSAVFVWTTAAALGSFENDTAPAVEKALVDADN